MIRISTEEDKNRGVPLTLLMPILGRGQYHTISYHLAPQCRQEGREIECGSISLHHNYGERNGALVQQGNPKSVLPKYQREH
jgi:hypothetical protein